MGDNTGNTNLNIDIVVPCYNEQEMISTFYNVTEEIVSKIENTHFTFIFINDGSNDDSLLIMKGLASTYDNVRYVSFSRNFGKESAILSGLEASSGDYVIVMDSDLQHPPAIIPRMVESVRAGHDCCAGYRADRKGEGRFRSFLSRNFYKFNNKMTNVNMPYNATDFRIMCRKAVDAIISLPEVQRFSKGIFAWVGFDTEWIPFENVERPAGKSKWSTTGLFKYAMDALLSFSMFPLKILVTMGSIFSAIAMIFAVYELIKTLVIGKETPGYASTIIVILFIGGILEISLGIIGEYIGRIFTEIKHRPVYIVKETNVEKQDEGPDKETH